MTIKLFIENRDRTILKKRLKQLLAIDETPAVRRMNSDQRRSFGES
jgi:hypothetical protein